MTRCVVAASLNETSTWFSTTSLSGSSFNMKS
jgi:hypothetical protein